VTVGLEDLHDELRAVARDVLGVATPLVGDGGAPPPADWAQMADMGWLGLEVPEALGGAGATFAEVAVLLEELGRAATVSPFLGTVVLGAGALALAEPSTSRDDLLEQVAAGRTRLAAVLPDHGRAAPDTPFALTRSVGGMRLDGRAELVIDVPGADRLAVVALGPDGKPVLVVVSTDAPGLERIAQPLVDETRAACTVVADDTPVAADSVLRFAGDPVTAVGRLCDRGALAVACDSLGLGRAMLDATVAYAGARRQFGRPIGSFQAVKHACADMLVRLTVSDELVRAAVRDVVAGDPGGWASVAMAKAHAGQSAVEVAGKAMQLHGGIGYAWESGVHVYLKRAALDRTLFGSPAHHRRMLAERLVRRADPDRPGAT
jgi:alkylation response protein AidB-like acyl-CoA dehydrogenase